MNKVFSILILSMAVPSPSSAGGRPVALSAGTSKAVYESLAVKPEPTLVPGLSRKAMDGLECTLLQDKRRKAVHHCVVDSALQGEPASALYDLLSADEIMSREPFRTVCIKTFGEVEFKHAISLKGARRDYVVYNGEGVTVDYPESEVRPCK